LVESGGPTGGITYYFGWRALAALLATHFLALGTRLYVASAARRRLTSGKSRRRDLLLGNHHERIPGKDNSPRDRLFRTIASISLIFAFDLRRALDVFDGQFS
jgi:hypothetical protein